MCRWSGTFQIPWPPSLTESDIRRIVLEELANRAKERNMTTININGIDYNLYRKAIPSPCGLTSRAKT